MVSVRTLLFILARFVAMALCGFAAFVAVNWAADRFLPSAGSFDRAFDRIGSALAYGGAAGVVLGALLTYPLGRGTFDAEQRLGHMFIALTPYVLLGWFMIMNS